MVRSSEKQVPCYMRSDFQVNYEQRFYLLDENICSFLYTCVQCSWGSKPTPPGTASNPLAPPTQPYQILPSASMNQGYSPADLLAYQRQLALSQAAASGLSGQALLQMTGQHGLASASMGLSSGGSQAMYDGYPNNSSGQQLMYYR